MATQNRRSSSVSSSSSSLAKRNSSSENLAGKLPAAAKKRPALADVSNRRQSGGRTNVVCICFVAFF